MKIARREGPVAERMGERDLDGNVETEVRSKGSIRLARWKARKENWRDSTPPKASPLHVKSTKRGKTRNVEGTEGAVFVLHRANKQRIGTIHRFYPMNPSTNPITRKGNFENHRVRRLLHVKTTHQLDRWENHLPDARNSHYASLQNPDRTFIGTHRK